MEESELYHYGKKGMHWGVVRSKKNLSNKVNKLGKRNDKLNTKLDTMNKNINEYQKKSLKANLRNSKYESRVEKANVLKAKYDLKTQKQLSKRHTNENKVAKYSAKSDKYNNKILRAQQKIKYNKWHVKAEEIKLDAMKTKSKIEKNEKLKSMYSKTITGLDNNQIKKGRLFMQYIDA